MAIDEHPVHMVFAPVVTEHPAIQDGRVWAGQAAKICPSWILDVCWGGERLLIGRDAQYESKG